MPTYLALSISMGKYCYVYALRIWNAVEKCQGLASVPSFCVQETQPKSNIKS